MSSHRIHLRGPWDYDWKSKNGHGLVRGTASMPKEWSELFGSVSGTAVFRRKFHKPTNLDPDEQVILVLTEVGGSGDVDLNHLPVGQFNDAGGLVEFDITRLLKPFNELAIQITVSPDPSHKLPGGLFGVVALDIRCH